MGKRLANIFMPKLDHDEVMRLACVLDAKNPQPDYRIQLRAAVPVDHAMPADWQGLLDRMA